MKEILLSDEVCFYPVGEHINHYFHICKEIAELITLNFPDKSITFWCQGSSGAIISALVSQHLPNSNIYHVKKTGENSHSYSISHVNDINIIIDDLMCSGNTVENIANELTEKCHYINCIVMTGRIKKALFNTCFTNQTKLNNLSLIIAGSII